MNFAGDDVEIDVIEGERRAECLRDAVRAGRRNDHASNVRLVCLLNSIMVSSFCALQSLCFLRNSISGSARLADSYTAAPELFEIVVPEESATKAGDSQWK